MIESVDFWPRHQAEAARFSARQAVISVTDPGQAPAMLAGAVDVLRLSFYDLPAPVAGDARVYPENLFGEKHAQALRQFVDHLHGLAEQRMLVVHCEAGVSRSAAVALCVAALTGCAFPNRARAAYANTHVVQVCAEAWDLTITPPAPVATESGILLF